MKIAAFYENIMEGAAWKGLSVETAVKDLMQEGLELLYISWFTYQENAAAVEEVLEKTGAGLEGMYMFCSLEKDPSDRSYEALIDTTARLGGGNVLLVPGFAPLSDPDREKKIENMVLGMTRAVSYGSSRGIEVSMEDFDGIDAPYCSRAGLRHFLENVPGLKCAFDTGNFIMYQEDELQAFHEFRDRICTIHLKDRSRTPLNPEDSCKLCSDGTKEYPAPVGYGYIRMEEILQWLKNSGYQGNVIAELYDYGAPHMLEGIRSSVRWLKGRI